MTKDLLAVLRRIGMVAHYALENEVAQSDNEVAQSLNYIIEEVTEALNKADEARIAMYALLDKKLSVDDMHELRKEAEGKIKIYGEYDA